MDKREYKLRIEEIEKLKKQKDYRSAADVADGIDWRRVKSVVTLIKVADIYRQNKRLEDCRSLLEMAYDRNPQNKNVIYGLCEVSLEEGDIVSAIEYYKEYIRVASEDIGSYILRYRIYEAKDVNLEERIELLEKMKQKERLEDWQYELAYLYHRAGFRTKCVEECDDIIFWFPDGSCAIKAMELKMLHEPLTPQQREIYEKRNDSKLEEAAQAALSRETEDEEDDFRVKTINMGVGNTIDLEAELKKSLEPFLEDETGFVSGDDWMDTAECRAQNNQVNHETIPADVKEVFFADKTGDIQDVIAAAAAPAEPSVEYQAFRSQYGQRRDMEEIHMEEEVQAPVYQTAQIPPYEEQPAYSGGLDEMLTQGGDGQISMVTPAADPVVEKQITGQMNLRDFYFSNWETIKKQGAAQYEEEIKQKVSQHTGELFKKYNIPSEFTNPGVTPELDVEMKRILDGDKKISGQIHPTVETVTQDTIKHVTVIGTVDAEITIPEAPVITPTEPMPVIMPAVQEPERDVVMEQFEEACAEEMGVAAYSVDDSDVDLGQTEYETPEAGYVAQTEIQYASQEEVQYEAQVEMPEVQYAPQEEVQYEAQVETPEVQYAPQMEESAYSQSSSEEPVYESPSAEQMPSGEAAPETGTNKLSPEEKALFSPFIYAKEMRRQLAHTLDVISLASYTGNVIITSEFEESGLDLAKLIIRFVQTGDSNFSGKVAKITASGLNKKDMDAVIGKLTDGALIIQNASGMTEETLIRLLKALNNEEMGLIVLLLDKKRELQAFIDKYPYAKDFFNGRIDIVPMKIEVLITYAANYARDKGYAVDELGHLALYKKISDRQLGNRNVTLAEVKEIMDEAISRASKKKLFAKKKKNEEGYILLMEKDFE
ncbi:MAG: hypothetical protein IJ291_04075 [Lachnospiraceae bacterium]|nr:hypothetical protein [Lachnospiraceae bacterium]